jgi:hypothetical protein
MSKPTLGSSPICLSHQGIPVAWRIKPAVKLKADRGFDPVNDRLPHHNVKRNAIMRF